MVVDFTATRLDDVNVLSTDRFLNLNPGLTNSKFGQQNLRWGNPQDAANCLSQLRVGCTPDDDEIADHGV